MGLAKNPRFCPRLEEPRRSDYWDTGSIFAITIWLHYPDHQLAPYSRSRSGSNVAIADTDDRNVREPALLKQISLEVFDGSVMRI